MGNLLHTYNLTSSAVHLLLVPDLHFQRNVCAKIWNKLWFMVTISVWVRASCRYLPQQHIGDCWLMC